MLLLLSIGNDGSRFMNGLDSAFSTQCLDLLNVSLLIPVPLQKLSHLVDKQQDAAALTAHHDGQDGSQHDECFNVNLVIVVSIVGPGFLDRFKLICPVIVDEVLKVF
jgi:hypothetical protein